MPLWAMAFSECRMRLTALEVNVSICVSDRGCTTSDRRKTFFLPLGPAALQQIQATVGELKPDLRPASGGPKDAREWAHLVCATGRMGSGSFLMVGAASGVFSV